MNRFYRAAFAAAFKVTLPVLAGYLAIGIAFGLMLEAIGFNTLWAFFMSLIIYAGSGQYLGVELLRSGAGLIQVALLTLLINLRHVVYGLSMLDKFRGMRFLKPYMIFSLTDETYALLSAVVPPDDINPKHFFFAIALLDHLYWILGSIIGSFAGALLSFNTQGVEFAMTALFIVIAVEQWLTFSSRLPALIGGGISLLSLIIFGQDNLLLPALVVIVVLLLLLKPRLEPLLVNTISDSDGTGREV